MSEARFTIYPQIEVNLMESDIDDIMATALDGAIGYWCRKAEVVEAERRPGKTHEQISKNGILILHSANSDEKWELTRGMFLRGLKLYFEKGSHVHVEDNFVDCEDMFSNDADCIIQFALFGEIRFNED